jgi:hypothetical protein
MGFFRSSTSSWLNLTDLNDPCNGERVKKKSLFPFYWFLSPTYVVGSPTHRLGLVRRRYNVFFIRVEHRLRVINFQDPRIG